MTDERKPRKRPQPQGAAKRGRTSGARRSSSAGRPSAAGRPSGSPSTRRRRPADSTEPTSRKPRPRRAEADGQGQKKAVSGQRSSSQGRKVAPDRKRPTGVEKRPTRATKQAPTARQAPTGKRTPNSKAAPTGNKPRGGKTPQGQRPQLTAAQRAEIRARHAKRAALRRRLSIIGAVLFFVVGFVLVARYSLTKIDEHTTAADPAVDYTPVACTADMLNTTLHRSGDYAGQRVNVGVEVTNTDPEVPCYIEPSENKIRVEVTSGDQTMFDSIQCSVPVVSQRLLLSPGLTTRPIVSWDGLNGGASCTGTSPSTPGTYVARAYFEGQEMTDQGLVFELVAAPAKDDE